MTLRSAVHENSPMPPLNKKKRSKSSKQQLPVPVTGEMRERFCQEYAVDLDMANAFLRAGFVAKNRLIARNSAARFLKIPEIQERIKEICAERMARTKSTQDWVLGSLREIALRCMQGVQLMDEDGRPSGFWTFNAKDAIKALELIGRHQGMFAVVQGGPGDTLDGFGVVMLPEVHLHVHTPLPPNPTLNDRAIRAPRRTKLAGELQRKFLELHQKHMPTNGHAPEANGNEVGVIYADD